MAQASSLIQTLKKQLKAQGKTYTDVGQWLELSEASVKRLFADENFTLLRLEKICQMLGLEFSELVQAMINERSAITSLSHDQEQTIASDMLLLLITVCVINGYTYDELFAHYELDANECIRKLAILDRLKIIDLLPGNRIKLLIAPNFSWLPNGPIQQFFQHTVEKEFFSIKFDQATEKLVVLNGLMSDPGNADFQKKMRRLANEFNELCQQDKSLPLDQKHGTSVVIAVRQWQYSLFDRYRKQ